MDSIDSRPRLRLLNTIIAEGLQRETEWWPRWRDYFRIQNFLRESRWSNPTLSLQAYDLGQVWVWRWSLQWVDRRYLVEALHGDRHWHLIRRFPSTNAVLQVGWWIKRMESSERKRDWNDFNKGRILQEVNQWPKLRKWWRLWDYNWRQHYRKGK